MILILRLMVVFMVLVLNKIKLSEELVARIFVNKLRAIGYRVYSNIKLNSIEIDVLALEPALDRSIVYVYEIKTRPKNIIVDQLSKRMLIADYLYVVVPVNLYPWILRKISRSVGVIIYIDNDFHVFKHAEFLGNGLRTIEEIRYCEERSSRCNS